jgi:hypothetical protein
LTEPSTVTYSLDGKANVTIAGNSTLTNLPDGSHSLVVYANDTAGNMGKSETIFFTADTTTPSPTPSDYPTQQPTIEPSPTAYNIQAEDFTPMIIIFGLVAGAVVIGLLVYFEKYKGWK